MPDSFSGRCACGAIRYECSSAPVAMCNCHCRDCQRASGGAGFPAVLVPGVQLVVRGEPRYHVTEPEPGKTVRRGFCPHCGSPLFTFLASLPGIVAIKAGSLDDPSWFHPTFDMWTSSAQPWDVMDPALPKFPNGAPSAA